MNSNSNYPRRSIFFQKRFTNFTKTYEKRNHLWFSMNNSFSLRTQTRTVSLLTKRKQELSLTLLPAERTATCIALLRSLQADDVLVIIRALAVLHSRLLSRLTLFYVFLVTLFITTHY